MDLTDAAWHLAGWERCKSACMQKPQEGGNGLARMVGKCKAGDSPSSSIPTARLWGLGESAVPVPAWPQGQLCPNPPGAEG